MHVRRVGTVNLDAEEHLLTCVAHLDLVVDPLQDTCHAHMSKIHS